MSTAPIDQKLIIILKTTQLLRERIVQIINTESIRTNAYSHLLKELRDLPISQFIDLSKKALSEFNASTFENSTLSIPVKRIIEKFTEIKVLINSSSSTPKRSFFSHATEKIDLEKLQEKLADINVIFNMHPFPTPAITDKSSIKAPALGT